ncbi:MAG: response regulator, partial [Deltaproteobacteria bacterium]
MSENQSSGAVILCIDDDREVRNLLEKILTVAGYTVISAVDGRQGLIEARNNKPDLILLDVMMPGMEGFSVCSQLQADQETAYIPVIFLTALGGEEDRTKAFAVGAVDYLAKPAPKEILLAKVAEQIKTSTHWKKLKKRVVVSDGTSLPAHFSRFKQSLIDQFDPSPDIRDRLAATAPLDIYNICEPMGITQGEMTALMAEFLSLPLISAIDPAKLLLGSIPASFAIQNRVVAMLDEKHGKSFILSNPFDWILQDTLKKYFGLQLDTALHLAEPDQIKALFEQPQELQMLMSAAPEKKPTDIPKEPEEQILQRDVEKGPVVAITNNILSSAVNERA